MYDTDSRTRTRPVRVSVDATITRPYRRGHPWTAEAGTWRAEGATEKAAADALAGQLTAVLTGFRPPMVLTFRGYTAVVWIDGTPDTWHQVITSPDGHQHNQGTSGGDAGEAAARARHSMAQLSTDWHDDASVYAGAASLVGCERYQHGQYGPADFYRYAAWQRAARAAMDAGREDWHEWASVHARTYALPAPDPVAWPDAPAPDPAPAGGPADPTPADQAAPADHAPAPGVRVRVDIPAGRVRVGVTRMAVRRVSGVVVGAVTFEPSMTRVRVDGSGVVERFLTEYLTPETPATSAPAPAGAAVDADQAPAPAPFRSAWSL